LLLVLESDIGKDWCDGLVGVYARVPEQELGVI